MSRLAPDLFDRRFEDLMEIGRARLRSLAPEWTDHNAHDPGITLMELLAWNTEAQLYSLARVRRDEREAYAALFGLKPVGSRPAQGILWPDPHNPNAPAWTYAKNLLIAEDAVIGMPNVERPQFRPVDRLLFVAAQMTNLQTHGTHGKVIDHTRSNLRNSFAFLPFGNRSGDREVLRMRMQCRDEAGLLGSDPKHKNARWAIGIRTPINSRSNEDAKYCCPAIKPELRAFILVDDVATPVPILSDTSFGMLTTGYLLLDLSGLENSPREFTLELRCPSGFPRPPRVLRIDPQAIPILQGKSISRELHMANGSVNASLELLEPEALQYEADQEPVVIEVAEASETKTWKRVDRLRDFGPDDCVYELDAISKVVTFGNGINGRMPPAEAYIMASYRVCDGEIGQVASHRPWHVPGFQGNYGSNLDPIRGGRDAKPLEQQKRQARYRARKNLVLVTEEDIVRATLELPLLEVARAWVAKPNAKAPITGTISLVAMRQRVEGEAKHEPETSRWLDAIRRCLAPRIPIGSRLQVAAPRYIEFSINASIEADSSCDPAMVQQAVLVELKRRLSLTGGRDYLPREPGKSLYRQDLVAWIRGVPGVRRILALELGQVVEDAEDPSASSIAIPELMVPSNALPLWIEENSSIDVHLLSKGGKRDR